MTRPLARSDLRGDGEERRVGYIIKINENDTYQIVCLGLVMLLSRESGVLALQDCESELRARERWCNGF